MGISFDQFKKYANKNKEYTDTNDFDNKYETAKLYNYLKDIYDNRFIYFNGIVKDTRNYLKPLSENNTTIRSYFNINKILDNLRFFDTCFVQIKYELNGKYEVATYPISYNINYNFFQFVVDSIDLDFLGKIIPNKQINENFEEIDSEYSYMCITYAKTATDEMIERMENMNIELIISSNNILKMNNIATYTPTGDYNPATKKYVDDSIAAIPAPDFTGLATERYVDNKVLGLVDSAPEALNTLNELAAALGDDANFATTVTNNLANKADISDFELYKELNSPNTDIFTILNGTIAELAFLKITGNETETSKRYINIEKNVSKLETNSKLVISYLNNNNIVFLGSAFAIKYENTLKCTKTSTLQINDSSDQIQLVFYKNRYFDENGELVTDQSKCCVKIIYANTINTDEKVNFIDNLNLFLSVANSNSITKTNTTEYTPTGDYNPATKKYVDDRFVNIDIASTSWVQNSGGLYELTYTHNLASENITVQVYNTDSKYEMFVDTQIVDSNSIKITSDENPNCAIRIVKF